MGALQAREFIAEKFGVEAPVPQGNARSQGCAPSLRTTLVLDETTVLFGLFPFV